MQEIGDPKKLRRIIRSKVGFLGNDNEKGGRTWHDLTRMRLGNGWCGADVMIVSPPSRYKKYFVPTKGKVPVGENHCSKCWS